MFLDPYLPLTALEESAQQGQMIPTVAKDFEAQSDKLEQVRGSVFLVSEDDVRWLTLSSTQLVNVYLHKGD